VSVFAVFEVDVHDSGSEAYAAYRAAVPVLIERFGGRYLARAATGRALEGAPTTARWHLVEFPNAEAADAFWASPEYTDLKTLRADAVSVRAILVEPGSTPTPQSG
jgi:uncharacterized protein (DUF1330 family)